MVPPRPKSRGVNMASRSFTACFLLSVLPFLILVGCSAAAKERILNWFFEIPATQTAESTRALPGQPITAATQPQVMPELGRRFTSVHPPFAQRRCTACHDAAQRMQPRKDALDSCRGCHERYFSSEVGHAPVNQGQCEVCHDMHQSREPALLKKATYDLCMECHDESELFSTETHRNEEARRCTQCHDAHFGAENLLKPNVRSAAGP